MSGLSFVATIVCEASSRYSSAAAPATRGTRRRRHLLQIVDALVARYGLSGWTARRGRAESGVGRRESMGPRRRGFRPVCIVFRHVYMHTLHVGNAREYAGDVAARG